MDSDGVYDYNRHIVTPVSSVARIFQDVYKRQPYYLVQGKALYKESDIQKVLDDAYKRCREEQRWV